MRFVKQLDLLSGKWVIVDTNPSPDQVIIVVDGNWVDFTVDALNAAL